MHQVVGVRFKKAGKIYYFSPGEFELEKGEAVIVETARGIEYGRVVIGVKTVGAEDVVLPLKQVIRIATAKDKLTVQENREAARNALDVCTEKIQEHDLDMKLVDVEYTFDRNKVLFYFTADGRIDFRELVKDLAAIFRTRIELRQIGVRDEAKMLGGIGPCGRMLCCSSFLGDFEPVSIKMAKDQNLSLNPAKISGLCGRLMCCLKYENDMYETAKQELPDVGKKISTPDGIGKVIGLNILEQIVQVELFEGERILEFTLDELVNRKAAAEAAE
ncbi:stage 0 sporulation protein [Alkalihalobacillus alcalophilus ATCC 27647 = CGMCC 1.3604]|uniref:Stage 0 sporulation protein n=1 Tax=Alkalihalobacillus alcalophilus ATCC 27647 = CGMCC 1.3604 TaxID=1218173 RepID=A0A094XCE3_ALKAL|nr:stage 0 sporulation family protein [Alkalihalobacillus alcalophilus]KGA96465.1 stage 0 sporulation protein [Alkalihalobacillus alcalophilus ATCC 27647 = CGMCC 1.3604]MED1560578.1 stage 0 sporulation family protein [Alkalihalobacillus alcalophilus]THG89014.1 stage 0 sporulation protein [Alkalihalobacillus alcalophilus ATCC 27647 = CGMCC 1.3604]